MKGYDQRVSNEDNWLTTLFTDNEKERQFAKVVHLPIGQVWDEWTAEQYNEWQDKYNPQPEPEPEPSADAE